ncbi:hypothetical protein [Fusobacterium nucleatum]|uniref:hypothetical protein n=1 Tax=Fusobacterium nucleatum TaxID=851 RepID=UPI00355B348E
MNLFLERNFLLKATIVKILRKQKEKKSKINMEIWGHQQVIFFIFKHEYIMVFKKKISKKMIKFGKANTIISEIASIFLLLII